MTALNLEKEGNQEMLQEIKKKVNKYKLFSRGTPGSKSFTNKHDSQLLYLFLCLVELYYVTQK